MLGRKRNKRVREEIERYLAIVGEALECLSNGVEHYLQNGLDAHFARIVDQTHQKESEADDIRRAVEIELYEKSLLPDSREDILLLLERLDLIPNQAEDVLRAVLIQQVELPKSVHDRVSELVALGCQAYRLVDEAVRDALTEATEVNDLTRRISEAETLGDHMEQQIITDIFAGKDGTAKKILFREVVEGIGAICDLAQDVAYFLTIFVVKRQV